MTPHWVLLLFAGAFAAGESADTTASWQLHRAAFASCAKQYKSKEIFRAISKDAPEAFFWIGDAGYPVCEEIYCVREAYQELFDDEEYQRFLATPSLKVVEGVWDDHDFGTNDGGKEYPHKDTTQQLFLDFLKTPSSSPRRRRQGLYHSMTFGEEPRQVKFIFLDARYFRDAYAIDVSGGLSYRYLSHASALTRWFSSLVGFGARDDRDMLGETQWQWLENELRTSRAAVHVIASSVQVLTPVSYFESWGHFPKSLDRLVGLLRSTQPPGVLLLSGDVHFGQILGNPSGILEVTSSGLTHTILENKWAGPFLLQVAIPWSGTMWLPKDSSLVSQNPLGRRAVYEGKNYATLDFDFDEGNVTVVAVVKDINGVPRLRTFQTFPLGDRGDSAARVEVFARHLPRVVSPTGVISVLLRLGILGVVLVWIPQLMLGAVVLNWRLLMRHVRPKRD